VGAGDGAVVRYRIAVDQNSSSNFSHVWITAVSRIRWVRLDTTASTSATCASCAAIGAMGSTGLRLSDFSTGSIRVGPASMARIYISFTTGPPVPTQHRS
jgi:hypothetical protein